MHASLICMLSLHGVCYALYIGGLATPTAFAPTPYVINAQDPYAVGIPIAGQTCCHTNMGSQG